MLSLESAQCPKELKGQVSRFILLVEMSYWQLLSRSSADSSLLMYYAYIHCCSMQIPLGAPRTLTAIEWHVFASSSELMVGLTMLEQAEGWMWPRRQKIVRDGFLSSRCYEHIEAHRSVCVCVCWCSIVYTQAVLHVDAALPRQKRVHCKSWYSRWQESLCLS